MTDIGIGNNIFVDFNSLHTIDNDISLESNVNPVRNFDAISKENEFGLGISNGVKRAKWGFAIENGIAKVKELITGKVTTKQICLEGDDGEKICLDKNQLKELLQKNNQAPNSNSQTPNSINPSDLTTGQANSNDQNSNPAAQPPVDSEVNDNND